MLPEATTSCVQVGKGGCFGYCALYLVWDGGSASLDVIGIPVLN